MPYLPCNQRKRTLRSTKKRMTPHRKIVSTWPAYLLKRVPADLRAALILEAEARDRSVQDVIRQHLCRRFRLSCPSESYHHDGRHTRSENILLRMQPKLHRALHETAERTGKPMRTIILETLERTYRKDEHQ